MIWWHLLLVSHGVYLLFLVSIFHWGTISFVCLFVFILPVFVLKIFVTHPTLPGLLRNQLQKNTTDEGDLNPSSSDHKALRLPSFTVTQTLVNLLAENGGMLFPGCAVFTRLFSLMFKPNSISEREPKGTCSIQFCTTIKLNTLHYSVAAFGPSKVTQIIKTLFEGEVLVLLILVIVMPLLQKM